MRSSTSGGRPAPECGVVPSPGGPRSESQQHSGRVLVRRVQYVVGESARISGFWASGTLEAVCAVRQRRPERPVSPMHCGAASFRWCWLPALPPRPGRPPPRAARRPGGQLPPEGRGRCPGPARRSPRPGRPAGRCRWDTGRQVGIAGRAAVRGPAGGHADHQGGQFGFLVHDGVMVEGSDPELRMERLTGPDETTARRFSDPRVR